MGTKKMIDALKPSADAEDKGALSVFDRSLQAGLLVELAYIYPERAVFDGKRVVGDPVTVNLCYLEGHGLVVNTKVEGDGLPAAVVSSAITHLGLDFIAGNDGLSHLAMEVKNRMFNKS